MLLKINTIFWSANEIDKKSTNRNYIPHDNI